MLAVLAKTETDYLSIKNWPEDERPREKLIKTGCVSLTNSELLAIVLRTGFTGSTRKQSALDLAKTLLLQYKDLNDISELSVTELSEIKGIGWAKAAQIIASFELGRRKAAEKNGSNISFRCSEEVANYYIPILKDLKNEQFRLVMLNIKNKIIREVMISQGSLTSSLVRLVQLFFNGKVKSMALLV
jgi:DNA repair protein RadC